MEDDQKISKWKTTKTNQNGRRPKKFKMEDEEEEKNANWKMTEKNQNGG